MHRIIKYYFIALDLSFKKKKKLGHHGKTPDAMSKFTPQTISKTTLFIFAAKIIKICEIYVRGLDFFTFISQILLLYFVMQELFEGSLVWQLEHVGGDEQVVIHTCDGIFHHLLTLAGAEQDANGRIVAFVHLVLLKV